MAFSRMTVHALTRAQQRCIDIEAIRLLLDYGLAEPAGAGFEKYYLPSRTLAEIKNDLQLPASRIDRFKNLYAVVSADGSVVTVGRLH